MSGRPEKLGDVCYCWFEYASLKLLGEENSINKNGISEYILNCQDSDGGIFDRPGNLVDVFHTFFGLACLSILNDNGALEQISPKYALPEYVLKKLFLS